MHAQGIVRRFQDQVQSGSSQANVQAFQQLPYSVQLRLTPYYQNGIIGQNDIEARVRAFLRPLSLSFSVSFKPNMWVGILTETCLCFAPLCCPAFVSALLLR